MPDRPLIEATHFSGVSELVLEVVDLESSEWFYGHLLDLPVVDRWPDAVWLLAGATRIGLWRSVVGIAGARGGAHVHFALHLSDAGYDAIVARVRAHRFDPHDETFEAFARSRAADASDPHGDGRE